MQIVFLFRAGALAALLALFASPASAALIADWTLANGSFTGGGNSGFPKDTVGGHDFLNTFGSPSNGTGASAGGPSSSSTVFNGGSGFYGESVSGSTVLPTDNFVLDLWVAAANTTQNGIILSSTNPNVGSFQIRLDGSGNWNALVNNSASNSVGTTLGSVAATTANTELTVSRINGIFSFAVNGVSTGVTANLAFSGFTGIHLAVAPGGGGPNFAGRMSDVTISTVPEPASLALAGIGLAVLFGLALRRRG